MTYARSVRPLFLPRSVFPYLIPPPVLRPGLISQANGSAYIEADKIKIACAVYGPRQNKNVAYSEQGRLNVEVKYAPYATARRKAPLRVRVVAKLGDVWTNQLQPLGR